MERGGLHGNHSPPKSSSGLEINESSNNNSNTGKTRNRNAAAAAMRVREQDKYMPIANVIRIMRRVLPANAKISDEAKETIQECVSEYIGFITSEANERCRREQRKTVTAEDLLKAMKTLGFQEYIEPLSVYLDRYREMESDRGLPLLKRTASTMETVGVADLGSGLSMVYDPGVFGYLRAGSSTNSSHAVGPAFGPYAPYK